MKNLKLFRAAGTGARWLIVACLTLFCCQSLCAQSQKNADHSCTVRILDNDGNPVSGAAVVVKGSNTGEISDAKGFVRFRNIPRNATLLVTYLGMDNREEPVNGRSAFDIRLSQGSLVMDELVVVGYGVQRKRDLSGAVAQVKGDLINEFANVSVAQALQGRVSGVQINQLNGQPGAATPPNGRNASQNNSPAGAGKRKNREPPAGECRQLPVRRARQAGERNRSGLAVPFVSSRDCHRPGTGIIPTHWIPGQNNRSAHRR